MQLYGNTTHCLLSWQVRNLGSCVKVAVDFVLPESLTQAFKFAEEFRVMAREEAFDKDADGNSIPVHPKDRQHTDKLQAELSMCLAAKSAVELLQEADRQPKNTGVCAHLFLKDMSMQCLHVPPNVLACIVLFSIAMGTCFSWTGNNCM